MYYEGQNCDLFPWSFSNKKCYLLIKCMISINFGLFWASISRKFHFTSINYIVVKFQDGCQIQDGCQNKKWMPNSVLKGHLHVLQPSKWKNLRFFLTKNNTAMIRVKSKMDDKFNMAAKIQNGCQN